MHNVGNDNSSRYEGPYTKRKRRSRRQKATYNDDPEDTMDDLSSFSPPAFPHVSVSSSMPAYLTAAQNVDGTPEVAFDVEGEEGEMDESDNLGSSFEYEKPLGNEVNGPNIADGMASLTLNDTLRPAISRVKSAPPLEDTSSETSNHRPPISNPNPRLSESTQELPAHIQYPFKCADPALPRLPFQSSSPYTDPDGYARPDLNPSTSKPERQPLGPASPSSGAQSVPEAFGIKPSFIKPPPSGGNIVFNDINGDYSKTDQSVHNTFLNSGNTANTLVLDSYNDNSVRITRLL
ncbi:hypothetical protein CPC08DRAFT_124242 [Agrocybe pediades]|nr:hypothetical protein CPC08DRAFT_124242 [Agrocybe pediades]